MKQWLLLAPVLLLLNACKTVPVAGLDPDKQASSLAAYEQRAVDIGGASAWNLVGRISLDDGEEGGSGRLQWVVKAENSTLDFHGAMGRGAWHLEIDSRGAHLRFANGEAYFEPGVDALIEQQIGWPVPVEALQWWVRGLAAPGPVYNQQLDAEGLLVTLHQFGWQVDFNRYASDSGTAMPTRLVARKKDYRVKLAISHWHIASNGTGEN